jgi:hypothetical protein
MRHSRVLWLSVVVVAILTSGCVHRELAIKSTPADATVEVDGRILKHLVDGQIADQTTPVELPFYWYGTHEIILHKEGYKPAVRVVHLRPPWYEQFPIDIVADLIIPWTITDRREVSIAMAQDEDLGARSAEEKQALKTALLQRAAEFRTTARNKVGTVIAEEAKEPETAKEE